MSLEGAPVLCKRCGAATEVRPDLTAQCRFCGLVDRLPADELGRVLEIRGRLAMASAKVAQLASTESALASIFERRSAFWSILGPFPLLTVVIVLYAAYQAYSTLDALPDAVPTSVRIDLLVAALYAPALFVGITISLPLALLVGRISYRRSVRPKLLARPPRWSGAPMRCRGCGADLPATREATVTCRYCQTANVLAAEISRDAAQRLDQELAAYRAQASGVLTGTSRAATHMSRTVIVCFVLVYAGILGLGAVTRVVLANVL